MVNPQFWKGRRVFLTGHTGFKGSWLSLWLDSLGATVTGYALDPPTQPNLYEQARVADSIHSICGDIRDFSYLRNVIAECRPEVIIHMAAQSVVRRSYEDPLETYSTNVMGTAHLLEALRKLGHSCVLVNVTSDKCYENKEWDWGYRESDPLGGRDPYSNSKACAELITSSFRDSFFCTECAGGVKVAVASARAGNVIGGGDWTRDQLIPDLMRAFLAERPCLIRNRSAIRPWQFILDPLCGYLMLAERLMENPERFSSAWNFGPTEIDAKPVQWIADELSRLWGNHASWQEDRESQPHEAHYLKLEVLKAKAYLNWRSVISLKLALSWIVEWYRAFQSGDNLQNLTRYQIEQYELLAQG